MPSLMLAIWLSYAYRQSFYQHGQLLSNREFSKSIRISTSKCSYLAPKTFGCGAAAATRNKIFFHPFCTFSDMFEYTSNFMPFLNLNIYLYGHATTQSLVQSTKLRALRCERVQEAAVLESTYRRRLHVQICIT